MPVLDQMDIVCNNWTYDRYMHRWRCRVSSQQCLHPHTDSCPAYWVFLPRQQHQHTSPDTIHGLLWALCPTKAQIGQSPLVFEYGDHSHKQVPEKPTAAGRSFAFHHPSKIVVSHGGRSVRSYPASLHDVPNTGRAHIHASQEFAGQNPRQHSVALADSHRLRLPQQ